MKNIVLLTVLTMLAFAANSILVRLALASHSIGPLSFSLIRLLAGALLLGAIAGPKRIRHAGSWKGAVFLLGYVVFFSCAYLSLDTATGALILFATVQVVMIGVGIWRGERLSAIQWLGTGLAGLGLVWLLRPAAGASPDPWGALMMGASGLGWALYSLHGRQSKDATLATAGNFTRAFLLTLPICLPGFYWFPESAPVARGVALAAVSGAITSGLGYTIWYKVLPHIPTTYASVAQLSVPAFAAIGGLILLKEPLSVRLVVTIAMVLGGVGIVTVQRSPPSHDDSET